MRAGLQQTIFEDYLYCKKENKQNCTTVKASWKENETNATICSCKSCTRFCLVKYVVSKKCILHLAKSLSFYVYRFMTVHLNHVCKFCQPSGCINYYFLQFIVFCDRCNTLQLFIFLLFSTNLCQN